MIDGNQIRIGARGSLLSRQQAESVRARLAAAWPGRSSTIVIIETKGDRTLDTPLPEIGGKGVFTLEIEEALRAGEIDLAVHSLKDLPTELAPGIVIGAISERVMVTDALISRSGATLMELPDGAMIGTSSHRRAAQLRRVRPDLRPASIRGNIDTRIRKTNDPNGPYDAAVLASAGLERLALLASATEILPLELMLPAPGQGALAVQCRDEPDSRALLAAIDDRAARLATSAERAFLSGLGGGCSAPIACYGELADGRLQLRGRIVALDASEQVDVSLETTVSDESMAIAAGAELAAAALESGATTAPAGDRIMNALDGLRVVNTRSQEQAGELNALLRAAGAIPLPYPCISIAPVAKIEEFDNLLQTQSFDWICLTSQNAAEMLAIRAQAIGLDRGRLTAPRYAVVGAPTATALKRHLDIDSSFTPETFDAESMARDCPIRVGERVLMPVSNLASEEPAQFLTEKGADVTRMVIYHTTVGKGGVDVGTLLKDGQVGAIIFTSPSAVSGFVKRLQKEEGNLDHTRQVPIACIGPSTHSRANAEGMLRAFYPKEHTLQGVLKVLNDVVASKQQGGRLWG